MNESLVESIRLSLREFLARNPTADLAQRGEVAVVTRPWDDPTIILQVSSADKQLIDALNSVYLPPRFTALWHTDSKDFEIIYTAYKLDPTLRTRAFDFVFHSRTYCCQFGDSSQRLIAIANASRPEQAPMETNHRNLQSYYMFHHTVQEHPESELANTGKPTSFWIRDVEYEENFLIEFARVLNFYMSYFDVDTPTILVHQPTSLHPTASPIDPRLPSLEFPSTVRAKPIDTYLLSLWESAVNSTDPFRRFIYFYQILEYSAFYRVQEDVLQSVRRILMAPDTLSRIEAASREILEAVVEEKMQDPQKFVEGVKRCVDPSRVWQSIEPFADHFAVDTKFDGGFEIPALIKMGWTVEDFRVGWSPKFADTLRKIRNALVHSREARMVGVIAPTRENYNKLAPWLPALRVAAMDSIVYSM